MRKKSKKIKNIINILLEERDGGKESVKRRRKVRAEKERELKRAS